LRGGWPSHATLLIVGIRTLESSLSSYQKTYANSRKQFTAYTLVNPMNTIIIS